MKTRLLLYALFLLISSRGMAQSGMYSLGPWHIKSISGEAKFKGTYRDRYVTLQEFEEFQQSGYFSGGMSLRTSSYIWHPNFLQLDIGGEFFPESNQDQYLVSPDRSEVRTLKGLNLAATLFNSKPITLSSWGNWNDSYSNRENLTNIKSNSRRLGSSLYLKNKILPLNIVYNNIKWDQLETETGRSYKTDQNSLKTSVKKSFSKFDKSEFQYSYNTYYRQDANLTEISNKTHNIKFNNSVYFDQQKRYILRSMIYNYRRSGSQDYIITNLTENLNFRLPYKFRFNGLYNFYSQQFSVVNSQMNKFSAGLSHQLYLSLRSEIKYELAGINHSLYQESRGRGTFSLNYNKNIPTGSINLNYSYSLLRNSMINEPVLIPVFNEEYLLADGEITILTRFFIDVTSIVVKDVTGTIIFQQYLDYILIESGDNIEIQRVPGGQIPNNSTVYIDYVALQTGSYKYDASNNRINGSISLFNRIVEVYYRANFLDYKNVVKSDLLVLNYIKRNMGGVRINYKLAEIGLEYEYQNSTITPYKMIRYYFNMQYRYEKIILSLHSNIRNYDMVMENINRNYSDLSGKASYSFSPRTKIDLTISYRRQSGPGIDLELFTSRMEFRTSYRQLFLTAGLDLYNRNYLNDLNNYKGAYLQLSRRF